VVVVVAVLAPVLAARHAPEWALLALAAVLAAVAWVQHRLAEVERVVAVADKAKLMLGKRRRLKLIDRL
jgi:hypothetical protein